MAELRVCDNVAFCVWKNFSHVDELIANGLLYGASLKLSGEVEKTLLDCHRELSVKNSSLGKSVC